MYVWFVSIILKIIKGLLFPLSFIQITCQVVTLHQSLALYNFSTVKQPVTWCFYQTSFPPNTLDFHCSLCERNRINKSQFTASQPASNTTFRFSGYSIKFSIHIRLKCRSQWPRGLGHEQSSLVRTLGSWVRIPFKALLSVLCTFILFVLFCV
jgi:hypothetical protein